MAFLNATSSWASVTLTQDEFWQPYNDAVLTADASFTPADTTADGGVVIQPREGSRIGLNFYNGDTVQYRLTREASGQIWREPR